MLASGPHEKKIDCGGVGSNFASYWCPSTLCFRRDTNSLKDCVISGIDLPINGAKGPIKSSCDWPPASYG